MPRHDYFSPWRIWKEMKKGEGRVSQEFLSSLAWFYAWQVVSLFLFFFIFLLFEDQTRRAVSWFTSSRMNSKGVLPPPSSFSIIPGDDLERMSTICVDSSPSRNNFFLSNGEGGGARLSPPCSPRVLLTFHASFPPIMTPFIFLEHTGNGRSISNESKSQIVVVFQREHNFTWSGFSFKKKKKARKKERVHAKGKWLTKSR